MIAAVFQGNRVLHHHMKMDYHIPADIQEDRLSFGPVFMKNVEPMKRWQVYYVSPEIQLDLQFDAVHAPYSWAESKLWMESEKAGPSSNHFDQVGRFTGEVRLAECDDSQLTAWATATGCGAGADVPSGNSTSCCGRCLTSHLRSMSIPRGLRMDASNSADTFCATEIAISFSRRTSPFTGRRADASQPGSKRRW